MARFKHIDTFPRFLAIDLERQLVPGTFEHALHHLMEYELDLSHFNTRFRNDASGAPAYPPAMLLKIVLFAYSRGLVSSRLIAQACVDQVTFIALSGDSQPHFTTIAHFVSTLGEDIAKVFGAVLAICDRQGLIGHQMFAIDGVKLPSNAAKSRSGTRADFERLANKHEAAAQAMLARHRDSDQHHVEPGVTAREPWPTNSCCRWNAISPRAARCSSATSRPAAAVSTCPMRRYPHELRDTNAQKSPS